jgi:DNA-binding winged helix-turn-helix (wHTH) protein/TolB-like protein
MDSLEYRVGRFTLKPFRQLLEDGQPVAIGRKPLELLSVLAKADGALVTKDELMAAVWPKTIVEDNAIQVHIAALRKVLGTDAELLATVHGLGYRLAAAPQTASPESRSEPAPEAPPAAMPVVAARRWQLPVLLAVFCIIALAGAGLWLARDRLFPAPPPSRPRIAVLPFEMLGADPALRQFAGGLEAEIIGQLSQNQLPVVSRQESADLKGQDLSAAAAKLHVAYTFAGTIERSGTEFLIRVRLDDARQGVTVWSSEYLGGGGDPRPLQDQIATQSAQVGAVAVQDYSLANGDTEAMSLIIKSDQYSLINTRDGREAE